MWLAHIAGKCSSSFAYMHKNCSVIIFTVKTSISANVDGQRDAV